MFGCLRRVGCAVILVVMAGGAYATRHRWLPFVTPGGRETIAELPWVPLSPDGARRARRVMASLAQRDGPVYANVAAADFASFLLDSVIGAVSDGGRVAESALRHDRIYVRTSLRVADLGAENVPILGGVADKSATVVVGGTLTVERPGLAELRVTELIVDAVSLPGPLLPRVTRALGRRLQRAGTTDRALGFALPPQVADVRISRGTVTLYKAAQ